MEEEVTELKVTHKGVPGRQAMCAKTRGWSCLEHRLGSRVKCL